MEAAPLWIECFDNSNLHGTNPVSSCVVFKNAKPSKRDYRHFNVKSVEGPNDFASMEEVVLRRYSDLLPRGAGLPQLVIIDGGKGQLSAAMKSIRALGLEGQMTVVGIAKRLEEIYFPTTRCRRTSTKNQNPQTYSAGPRRGTPFWYHLPPQPAQQEFYQNGTDGNTRYRGQNGREIAGAFWLSGAGAGSGSR
jgi:hypothetical protein